MILKKKASILIVVLTVLALIISGCGGNSSTGDNTKTEPAKVTNLSFTLGGTSGTWYIHGAAIAEVVNQKSTTIKLVPSTSGGSTENLVRVGKGEANLGLANLTNLADAWQGKNKFDKLTDLRFIGAAEKPIGLQLVVLKKSNIKNLNDLVGKTVVLGQVGSSARVMAEQILKEKGILDKVKVVDYSNTEIPEKLKNGDIAMFGIVANVPIARITEIGATHPVEVIDLTKDMEELKFWEKNPFYSKLPIPAGSYKGHDKDALTFAVTPVFIANKNVPDDAVYEFMKQVYNQENITAIAKSFSSHDQDSKTPLKDMIIPIHPGALKYWKEKGISIPEPTLK